MQFFPIELRQFDIWYGTLPKTMRRALLPACFAIFRFLFDYTVRRADMPMGEKSKFITELFYGRGALFTNTHGDVLDEMYRGFLTENYTCFLHTTSKLHKVTIRLTPWMDRLLKMHLTSFPNRILSYVFSIHVKVSTNQSIGNNETNNKGDGGDEDEKKGERSLYLKSSQEDDKNTSTHEQGRDKTTTKLEVHSEDINILEYRIIGSNCTAVEISKDGRTLYVGCDGYLYKYKCFGTDRTKYLLEDPVKLASIGEMIVSISVWEDDVAVLGIDGNLYVIKDEKITSMNIGCMCLSLAFADKDRMWIGMLSGSCYYAGTEKGIVKLLKMIIYPGPVTGICSVKNGVGTYVALSYGSFAQILLYIGGEMSIHSLITQAFPNPIRSVSIVTHSEVYGNPVLCTIYLSVVMRNGIALCYKYTHSNNGIAYNSGYISSKEWELDEDVRDAKLFKTEDGRVGAFVVTTKKALVLTTKNNVWGLASVVLARDGIAAFSSLSGLIVVSSSTN